MIKHYIILLFLFCGLSLHSTEQDRVLVISSYNSSYPTFLRQLEGLKSVFDSCSISMDLECLDTKKINDSTELQLFTELMNFKLSKIHKFYDAIITTDNNALDFVISKQNSIFNHIPIIFLGYDNHEISLKQNNNPYITGINESIDMAENIELMLHLFPQADTIYAISDQTKCSIDYLSAFYREAPNHQDIVFKTIQLGDLTFAEYQEELKKISPQNIVLLLSAYMDKDKNTIGFSKNLQLIKNNLSAPAFHLWESGIGEGLFGGKVISHYITGRKAAKLVNRIFNGEDLSNIKVDTQNSSICLFDYSLIKKYHLNKSAFPKDTTFLNKPKSIFVRYKLLIQIILPILLILAISTILLSKNYFKIEKTRKYLQNTIKLLYTTQKQTTTGSWITDVVTKKTFWTEEVYRIHNLDIEKTESELESYVAKSINCYEKNKQQDIIAKFENCLTKGIPYDGTYKFTDYKGIEKWVKTGAEPIMEDNKIVSVLGYIRDVTKEVNDTNELIKAKSTAEENENKFRHLFENNPVALIEEDLTEFEALLSTIPKNTDMEVYLQKHPEFVVDCVSKIKFLQLNRSTMHVFGYDSKSELIDNVASTFTAKSFDTIRKFILSRLRNEKSFIDETEYLKKDGTTINAFTHIFSFKEENNCIIAIVDISKLKNTEIELADKYMELQASEEELRTANEELIEAKERAEESDRLKTMFIQNMSHEIRTPMNGIIGFTSLLSSATDKSQQKQYIKIIHNSGNQLLRIIDDILEISRLGTHQVKLIEEKVNLNELMLDLFSIFDAKAKEKDLPLYIKKGLSDMDCIVLTDASKLNKILGNLLENALKFTNSGYIEFGYRLEEESLIFFVKDTGIGVSENKKELIFERFSQEDKDISVTTGGLGLGLAIAKENTKILGGEISLSSVKNAGSTFIVKIPYKTLDNKRIITRENNTAAVAETKVLIAEDEEINYLFLETLIENKLGKEYKILHAKNGKEAIEMCKNNEVSIVLMDIKMPLMDGFDATKEIRKFKPAIPIIAQTAYSTLSDREKAYSAGCNDFISKPINPSAFITIMNKHIHHLFE